ncbi:MAG: tRNA (guanosine(37)-N1)-methyltransferase TrmD [Planctomycetia bacterium]|nr:tRNA (guanosine(37)-N1)-methyltransferase TrmD [Planctomycetia bacterium]
MRFDVLTLFPEMFPAYLGESLFHQAIAKGLVQVGLHNMRDWTHDRHNTMDDRPFGGGPGMVLKVEPVVECVEAVQAGRFGEHSVEFSSENAEKTDFSPGHLILLTPQGNVLKQPLVEKLAERERLIFLCGRYEGFDDRVRQILEPEEISLGDYVLNGGEVAAMVLMEAVMRLIPGVLGDAMSNVTDSFSSGNRFLEGPQFTRPRVFRGLEVPEILLSGNHAEIERWRQAESQRLTQLRRPDLLEKAESTEKSPKTEPFDIQNTK